MSRKGPHKSSSTNMRVCMCVREQTEIERYRKCGSIWDDLKVTCVVVMACTCVCMHVCDSGVSLAGSDNCELTVCVCVFAK